MMAYFEIWAYGFGSGLIAGLVVIQIVLPFQMARRALREIETA